MVTFDLHVCVEDSQPQSSRGNTQLSVSPIVPEDGQGGKPSLVTVRSRLLGSKSLSRLPWNRRERNPFTLSCLCCPPRDSAFALLYSGHVCERVCRLQSTGHTARPHSMCAFP